MQKCKERSKIRAKTFAPVIAMRDRNILSLAVSVLEAVPYIIEKNKKIVRYCIWKNDAEIFINRILEGKELRRRILYVTR